MSEVLDTRVCLLGEGPLWHPLRQQLFWFDILSRRLMSSPGTGIHEFEEHVSAAGWIDRDTLMVASETGLFRLELDSGDREILVSLEAADTTTRSNDGRADPWGGFWIGTMGKRAEPRAGAIYRYYRGELRRLFAGITVSNAICFGADAAVAYFTDTPTGVVMRQRLAPADGWPDGAPEPFVDLRADGLKPDGAVVDAAGIVWIAMAGGGRICGFDAAGTRVHEVAFPARQTTCPAFGGADLDILFCTSAAVGLDPDLIRAEPTNGMTFAVSGMGPGQAEHRVIP